MCNCFWRIFCTQLYGCKYSYVIQIICTQLYGWKNSYLIQTICTQLYDRKYSYLIQIILTQSYGWKYSYLIQIICTLLYDRKYSYLIQMSLTVLWLKVFLSNTNNLKNFVNGSSIITVLCYCFWRIFCTQLYACKYSYVIQIICTQL